MPILKVIYLRPLFCQISYLLVLKIEIYLKYFLDKNPKKTASELSFSRVLVGHADMQRAHSGAQSAAGEPKVCATQWTKKPVFVQIRSTLSTSFKYGIFR